MGKRCSTLRNQERLEWKLFGNGRTGGTPHEYVHEDDLSHIPLQVRRDIPVVPLPTSIFSLASPSLEEVRHVIRKARNRSAPGPNGVPYLLYKRCPKVLYLLHSLIKKAWQSGRVDDEWKVAEGVYISKERDSHSLSQFRSISLLNVEGKVFFPSLLRGSLNMCCLTSTWIHQSRREAFQAFLAASSTPP